MIYGMPAWKFTELCALAILFPTPLTLLFWLPKGFDRRRLMGAAVLSLMGIDLGFQIALCQTNGRVTIYKDILFSAMIAELSISLIFLFVVVYLSDKRKSQP
jgi:hypothetical protein